MSRSIRWQWISLGLLPGRKVCKMCSLSCKTSVNSLSSASVCAGWQRLISVTKRCWHMKTEEKQSNYTAAVATLNYRVEWNDKDSVIIMTIRLASETVHVCLNHLSREVSIDIYLRIAQWQRFELSIRETPLDRAQTSMAFRQDGEAESKRLRES